MIASESHSDVLYTVCIRGDAKGGMRFLGRAAAAIRSDQYQSMGLFFLQYINLEHIWTVGQRDTHRQEKYPLVK